MPTILITDNEVNIRKMVVSLLEDEGFQCIQAGNGKEALRAAANELPDLVLLDLYMPEMDGIETLRKIKSQWNWLPVIMISGKATVDKAVEATKLGAFHFIEKPLSPESLLQTINTALELASLEQENLELRRELSIDVTMIGESSVMKELYLVIDKVAGTEARVLISGDSGTGKELVARAIHNGSRRRNKPFVKVNCAAIPKELIESEMFGHEKGAFTGAVSKRKGKFEQANAGTIFLDEIGDMSLDTQAKLLRVLQEGEFERVGGKGILKVDVRVIAATNKDIRKEISEQRFREDLYFRLNVVPLKVPLLRERVGDVPLLVNNFVKNYCNRNGLKRITFTKEATDCLSKYHWPGNVRELQNIIERIIIMYPGEEIDAAMVKQALPLNENLIPVPGFSSEPKSQVGSPKPLSEFLDDFERLLITNAIEKAKGNITTASQILNTDRPNLYRRMKRLGIGK